MRCAHCGHDNPPDANYCLECGTELRRCSNGHPLPEGARFCPTCGVRIPQAGALVPEDPSPHVAKDMLASPGDFEGERKLVSVLFCDIVHSTALAQRLGPERFHELVSRFFEIALEEVHRYQGTLNQFLGDGFMALFGAPVAREDHARQTVLAALAMRDALVAHREELAEDVAVRIGINTGLVVVGTIGDDLRTDYTAFGDTVVLAARLQVAAEPGDILVSADTAELLKGYFEFEPADEVVVKERTVQGYRVLGLGPRRARIDDAEPLNLTPFVGRERELETLLRLFADAKIGSGQVVGITGEPGVGKSRLVLEFCRQLDRDAVSLIETRCVPYGAAVPFLPLRDAVRHSAGITDDDDRDSVLRKLEQALVDVGADVDSAMPSLLDLLGIASGQRVDVDPATVKRRIFDTARLLLVPRSTVRPLVLVVEDLHWLDRTSEEFFAEFVDDVAAGPMLLVSTYRPGYGTPWIGKSFVEQLALRSLVEDESMHLVRTLLTEPAPDDVVARTIVSRAEGNPLFLEELAHAARERGPQAAAVDMPLTVQEIIAARIDSLDTETKGALQAAAVLGRSFSERLFEETWEGEGAVARLRELKRMEILYEPNDGAERTYGFRHGLTQEVAYDSVLERRRRVLHGRGAAALERLHADRLEEHYELLAYHYAPATTFRAQSNTSRSRTERPPRATRWRRLSATSTRRCTFSRHSPIRTPTASAGRSWFWSRRPSSTSSTVIRSTTTS